MKIPPTAAADSYDNAEDDTDSEDGEEADEDEKGYEVDEDGEIEIIGVVRSFSDVEIVLEDETSLVVNDDTEFETTLKVGLKVEIDAKLSGGKLTALEVDR